MITITATKWTAKNGEEVVQSFQHKDMFIVTQPNGKFHCISSNITVMETLHPPKQWQKN